MPYCIMRIAKLHSNGNVCSSLSHLFRTRQTKNANPELMTLNWFYPNCYEDGDKSINVDPDYREKMRRQAISMYKKRLKSVGKIRKNAVRAVEMVMTFSPEALDNPQFNHTDYLNDCKKWACDKFGAENVFAVGYHRDETTPHVSLILTPIRDGKLNAREYFGGRDKMIGLQDKFYESVGKKYGLERGLPKSQTKAKHKSIREYYHDVNKAEQNAKKARLVDESCSIPAFDGTTIKCTEGLYKAVQRSNKYANDLLDELNQTINRYNDLVDRYNDLNNNPKTLKQRLNEIGNGIGGKGK